MDSRLGISRSGRGSGHPQHEGLLPSGAQAASLIEPDGALVILPCRTLGGSSHDGDWFAVPQSPLPWNNFQLRLGRSSSVRVVGAQRSLLPFLGRWRSSEGGCWADRGHESTPLGASPCSACPPRVLSSSCSPQSLMSAAGGCLLGWVLSTPFLARLLP